MTTYLSRIIIIYLWSSNRSFLSGEIESDINLDDWHSFEKTKFLFCPMRYVFLITP